jgi:hypothetical protein
MKFVSTTRLEVRLEHAPDDVELVGHLVLHQRQIAFEYKAEFIERRPTISPLRLPLRVGLHSASESHLRGLFGVFDDSLPDGWGRLLMDRTFLARSIRPAELTALDRLAYLGRHTMGALTYHPCSEPDVPSETLDLAMLAAAARQLYDGTTTEVLPALRRAGGSPGGARPKVLVGMRGERLLSGVDTLPPDYQPWLIKFATRDDPPNAGALEFIYARMAVAAGIKMPEVQLLAPLPDGERCFAVRRFDRDDNSRIHVHTLANLLHADFRMPNLDYEHLLRITQKLTRSHCPPRRSARSRTDWRRSLPLPRSLHPHESPRVREGAREAAPASPPRPRRVPRRLRRARGDRRPAPAAAEREQPLQPHGPGLARRPARPARRPARLRHADPRRLGPRLDAHPRRRRRRARPAVSHRRLQGRARARPRVVVDHPRRVTSSCPAATSSAAGPPGTSPSRPAPRSSCCPASPSSACSSPTSCSPRCAAP